MKPTSLLRTHLTRAGKPSFQVVTLIKNNQSYSTTNLRSRFARVLPTQHQPTATRVAMVSLRARYYDTKTGEFGSPDPMEYVDGMSLYRACFSLNEVDPLGAQAISTEGQKTKNRTRCGNAFHRCYCTGFHGGAQGHTYSRRHYYEIQAETDVNAARMCKKKCASHFHKGRVGFVDKFRLETGKCRNLTQGEIKILREAFGGHLDLAGHWNSWGVVDGVMLCRGPHNPLTSATVNFNGSPWFPDSRYKDDFPLTEYDRWLLVHELTHTLQYQQRIPVKTLAVFHTVANEFEYGRAYRYDIDSIGNFDLNRYNHEQQAQILADYYALRKSTTPYGFDLEDTMDVPDLVSRFEDTVGDYDCTLFR